MILPTLTKEDEKMLELILEFYNDPEIADQLKCPTEDAKQQIKKVLELFSVQSRIELIMKCGRETLEYINSEGVKMQRAYFLGEATDQH